MKKISLFLLLIIFPFFVNAASVSLNGTTTISPGETVTLPIIVTDANKIYGAQMNFTLDSDDFELLIAKTTSSYQIIAATTSPLGISVMSQSGAIPNKGTLAKLYVKAKSTAKVGNKANLVLKNIIFATSTDGSSFKDVQASNYSKTLTVGAIKSTNNYLSSLEISGYSISFDKNNTSYTIVGKEGETLNIIAQAEDEKASVKVSSSKLVEGKNVVTVTVTAESGAKRVYTINANVKAKEVKNTNTNLKTLEVKGYNIDFKPDKTEYLLNVENNVTSVQINSTLENAKSTQKMKGPEELSVGENIYTITVTDSENNAKTYTITINRKEACKECEECKACEENLSGDFIWKLLAIALVIVTLAETIYMVTMRDKKRI